MTTDQFLQDCADGTLPTYSFIEPNLLYDHVPPPVVPAPQTGGALGQLGFSFQRSGVRIPAVAISPWIPAQTVVTDQYRNTSVIATLRQRWKLGPPLTQPDAAAADLSPVFSLDTPRDPAEWPTVSPQPVPPYAGQIPAPVRAAARELGAARPTARSPLLALLARFAC